jgi:uncharacterized protein YkwD
MKPLLFSTHLLLALALAGVASLPLLPRAAAQRTESAPLAEPAAEPATVAEQYLFTAANQERATRGLPLLHRDPLLVRSAAQHALAMADHASISHQFPGEPTLPKRAANAGLAFTLITENVGEAPSSVEIHDLWMHSEHHRDNLLDPAVDAIGIRVIARDGELYAVEDFAKTLQNVSLEEQESAIAALIAHSSRIALLTTPDAVADARKTCALSTGFAGTRKPFFVERFNSSNLTELPSQLKTQLASERYHQAVVGACVVNSTGPFTSYNFAVLLYP